MDNTAAHKVEEAAEFLKQNRAELLYLPLYSPDLNPIEMAWAKKLNIFSEKSRREPNQEML